MSKRDPSLKRAVAMTTVCSKSPSRLVSRSTPACCTERMEYGETGRETEMLVTKETLKLTTDTAGDDATVMARGRT